MQVTEAWIKKWYPEFWAKCEQEMLDANIRVQEMLAEIPPGQLLGSKELINSYKKAKSEIQNPQPGYYLPSKKLRSSKTDEIKFPKRGSKTELVYIWLILTNVDQRATVRILKRHPKFANGNAANIESAVSGCYHYYFKNKNSK